LKEIAAELNVANILTGSASHSDNQINISVQLIKAETGEVLWTDKFGSNMKDVLTFQKEVAKAVAIALKVGINPGVIKSMGTKPTLNPRAYEAYLQGVRLPHFNHQGVGVPYYNISDKKKSMELFKKAIELDSTFSPPYASLGFMMMQNSTFIGSDSVNTAETWKTAKKYFERSIKLDPENGEAHMLFAMSLLWFEWNFKDAGREYAEARRIYSLNSWTDYLLAMGRFDEAYAGAVLNIKADPMNGPFWAGAVLSAFFAGRNPEKIIKQAFSKTPLKDDFILRAEVARTYFYMRKFDKASLIVSQLQADYPELESSKLDSFRAAYLLKEGKTLEAENIIKTLKERSSRKAGGSPSYYLALICAIRNDYEQALGWLEKAYELHDVEVYWMKVEPFFKPLREDPRFLSLIKKTGIPD
jgi:tetratricopeptide (TPR) repeat protein